MSTLKEQYINEIASKIEINYVKNNDCYKAGRTIVPSGIVVHSIGVAQPSVDVIRNNFNKSGLEACVNAVMNNERIILTMPYNYRPWGCGAGVNGSWNNTRFQFEICEPAGHTYAGGTMVGYDAAANQQWFDEMYTLLIKFLVFLCDKFGIDSSVIQCHSESYTMGYGSNHSDVMQWFPKHNKSMDTVRVDVQKVLDGASAGLTYNEILPKATQQVDEWNGCIDAMVALGNKTDTFSILKYTKLLIEKIYNYGFKGTLEWDAIIREVASKPDQWITALNAVVAMAQADGDIGVLETVKYFKILLVKVYESNK